jgi:hypothetical protein
MMNFRIKGGSNMNRRFGFPWIWGLATAAIATIVGVIAYHAGQTASVVATSPGGGEVVYRDYGFGFGFFGLFWILLIGFLFFRFIFWRPWGRGPGGWGGHYHDHTHSPAPTTPATTPPATQPQDPTIA